MEPQNKVLIEGFEEEELLEWSKSEEFQALIFTKEPVIFKAGTSEILGQFDRSESELFIVFSHIEGGGEGVLIKLMNLFRKFARENKLTRINWIVHAVDCPKPNPKLPRILEMKGFTIGIDPQDGAVYKKSEAL